MLPVIYLPEADKHLTATEEYISEHANAQTAERYVRKIVARCDLIAVLPLAGRLRKGSVPGLRSMAFKGRVTIYYLVEEAVLIMGVRYGGQDEKRFLAALRR